MWASIDAVFRRNLHLLPLVLLGGITLFFQVLVLRRIDPVLFPDSETYLALAESILRWEWNDFFFRTPGYPLFLVLTWVFGGEFDPFGIATIQVLLSAAVPFLLYGIFWELSKSRWGASALAMLYFLDWPSQATTLAILTESLSILGVLIVVYLTLRLMARPSYLLAVAAGLAAFVLVMVRPAFLPLSPLLGALLGIFYWKSGAFKQHAGKAAAAALVPLVLVAGWCLEVKRETEFFSMSHITGIALYNQVGELVGEVDEPQYAQLADALQAEADKHNTYLNVGWPVVKAESERRGVGPWVVARELKHMSTELILEHPGAYLRKVLENLTEYWRDTATYVYTESATDQWFREQPVLRTIVVTGEQQLWLRPGRLLALAVVGHLMLLATVLLPRVPARKKIQLLVIAAAVLVCTLSHVLVNGADLARYRMPIQTIYLVTVVYLAGMWIRGLWTVVRGSSLEVATQHYN